MDWGKLGSSVLGAVPVVGQVAGAVAGVAGAFAGSSTTTSSGYKIPPAYEAQFLSYFDQAQKNYAQQISQIQSAMSAFQNKIGTLDKAIAGTLPSSQVTQELAQHNAQLALSLGMSGEELVKNGFINADDKATLDQMKQLTNSGNLYEDPQLKNQLADQRAQLNQNLAQGQASPAMRAQMLAQFDRAAQEQLFSRSQTLKSTQSSLLGNTLQASLAAKQQGFGQAIGSFGIDQNQLAGVQNTLMNQGSLANMGLQGTLGAQSALTGITGAQSGLFKDLGSMKLSGFTKSQIQNGVYDSKNAFSRDKNFNYLDAQKAKVTQDANTVANQFGYSDKLRRLTGASG